MEGLRFKSKVCLLIPQRKYDLKRSFVKRERIQIYVSLVLRLSFYPSNQCSCGGKGNRTSMRGGGLLTSLIQADRLTFKVRDQIKPFQNLWLF